MARYASTSIVSVGHICLSFRVRESGDFVRAVIGEESGFTARSGRDSDRSKVSQTSARTSRRIVDKVYGSSAKIRYGLKTSVASVRIRDLMPERVGDGGELLAGIVRERKRISVSIRPCGYFEVGTEGIFGSVVEGEGVESGSGILREGGFESWVVCKRHG